MNTLERTDGELAYLVVGDEGGHPLLLLHGLGADHRMWQPQIDQYPSEGLRLLVPDLRGHGASMRVDRLDISDWVADLRALIDAEGIERYSVAGVSMGGIVAQALVLADTERVARLILADTFCDLETFRERLLAWGTVQGLRLFRLLGKKVFAKAIGSSYESAPAAKAYFEEAVRRADLSQLVLARKAVNRVNHAGRLANVWVPTLHLVGDAPGAFFVELNAKVARAMPESRLVVLSGGSDPSNLTVPAAFDEQVLSFLADERGDVAEDA